MDASSTETRHLGPAAELLANLAAVMSDTLFRSMIALRLLLFESLVFEILKFLILS